MKHAAITDSVADRIAQALVRHGVEVIFAQSLPSAVILAAEAHGIRQIAYRQENMGGAMADGYARVSGKVSVVAAQNGPAATLLVPPLAEALKASIPVVALVQDVERNQTDKNAFQDIDQITLFQSCTKWVRRLNVAERVDDYIDAALPPRQVGERDQLRFCCQRICCVARLRRAISRELLVLATGRLTGFVHPTTSFRPQQILLLKPEPRLCWLAAVFMPVVQRQRWLVFRK